MRLGGAARYGSTSDGRPSDTPGPAAADDLRRDHDDQLGLVLLIRLALEQLAENRDVADAGNLAHRAGHGVVHQAGDRERLAVAQLDFGLGAARGQRRDAEALERDRVAEVERADFRVEPSG